MDDPGAPIPSDGGTPTADPADPGPAPEPGDRPAGRRLDAPPSQRYVQAARGAVEDDVSDGASSGRAVIIGGLVAAFVAAIMVILGVAFTMTAGLLVAAFFLGRLTAIGVRAGGGTAVSPGVRVVLSIGLSLAAVAVVQVALWAIAGVQGGSLGFAAFLDQTYGPLVLLEASVATLAAWWGAAR